MLRLDHASKRFGETVALAPTDLEILPGQTTVLIGPSGCGKSTILRLCVGLLQPDTGTVLFDGAPVTPANVMKVRRRMGYVIQEGGLFPHLTARANVILMARHLGWESARIEARLTELAELVRLPGGAMARYPSQLSGGQRQRVSLMRALMLDPEVLLLDEPLGALDPMIRYDLQNDLNRIFHSLDKTVLMVTHDIGEAAFFADTVVLMREGRVVQEGTMTELIDTPSDPFVEQFIQAQRSPLERMDRES